MTTVLQISLYGLIILGGIMLSWAEGAGFPDALTVPLAVLALFLTERWKLFCLPTRWANGLGLAAFGLGVWEFSRDDIEARLLSLAHVLVYLTWIVLFLEKSPRLYWTMCTLAVLHAAVGAVLTSSGFFGSLLVAFVVLAIWTLTVFTLSRARQRFDQWNDADSLRAITPKPWLTDIGGLSVRRPLATQSMPWNQRSQTQSTVQLDSSRRWISGSFVAGVFANVVLSGVVGGLFFLFTPRVWVGQFSPFGEGPDTPLRPLQAGFAEEVQLGDIGQILEGTQTVLEVRVFDHERDEPIDVLEYTARLGLDEPLFRGAVLSEYAHGRWRAALTGPQDGDPRPILTTPGNQPAIRQEFRHQPLDSGVLFAIPTHFAGRLDHQHAQLFERRSTSVLYRSGTVSSREPLRYFVFTEKIQHSEQLPFPRAVRGVGLHPFARDFYRRLPERGLERLQAYSQQLVQAPDGSQLPELQAAQQLERHLKLSGQFGYTLDMSVNDPTIDAVEDFLFNRKEGHCEYFASALALMLRAVGIPARLASGFKGGDLNPRTGYFVVQQRHAHVWVEAVLDGHWLILDPTPASRDESVKSFAPKATLWNDVVRFFNDLWVHRIVGMSMSEQTTSIYAPMKNLALSFWDEFQGNNSGTSAPPRQRDWSLIVFVIVSGVVTLAVAVLIASAIGARSAILNWPVKQMARLLNWVYPSATTKRDGHGWRARVSNWWADMIGGWRGAANAPAIRVEFYERFLKLARASGLEPLLSQTARELAIEARSRWAERGQVNGVADVPCVVAAQFYRVRFGGESLSSEELHDLDHQLAELEKHWRSGKGQLPKVTTQ